MLQRKTSIARAGRLLSIVLILVVFALVVSGCSSGEIDSSGNNGENGGSAGDGENEGNGGNNGGVDFSAYIGVWKSVGVSPAVEITVSEVIEDRYPGDFQYFAGRVTCNIFSGGHLDITASDNWILGKKYIMASIVKSGQLTMRTILVRAEEEVDDKFGSSVTNKLELDGYLADDKTLKASRLYIYHQDKTVLDFNPDDATELTFKRQ